MSRQLKLGLVVLLLVSFCLFVSSLLPTGPGARSNPSSAEVALARRLRSWTLPASAFRALLLIMSLALRLFAHGGMEHVLSTVVKIFDHSLSVKVSGGTLKEVLLYDQAAYSRAALPR